MIRNVRTGWKLPFSNHELEHLASAMLGGAGFSGTRAEVAILEDAEMACLHKKSFGYLGPTNILAFPAPKHALLDEGEKTEQALIGWLAFSVDALNRECFLYEQEPAMHCLHLLAHGLAHLLGYDHGPDMDALVARMEAVATAKSTTFYVAP